MAVAVVLFISACDNSTQPVQLGDLILSTTEWQADEDGSNSQTVQVSGRNYSDRYTWKVECDSAWLRVTPSSGTTPGSFVISADSNTTDRARCCDLKVKPADSHSYPQHINISQMPMVNLEIVGGYKMRAGLLTVDGDYVYTAGYDGLNVLNISDPLAPYHVGWFPDEAGGYVMVKYGDYLYIAGWTQVNIYDVSNPIKPEPAASYELYGCRDAIIIDHYLYLAEKYRIRVLDLSDPVNPTDANIFETAGETSCLDVCDNRIAFVDYGQIIYILDCSDPANPELVANFLYTSSVSDLCLYGDYMYLGCTFEGLQIVDISDPNNPQARGQYNLLHIIDDVSVRNTYPYIIIAGLEMWAFDVSDPNDPRYVCGLGKFSMDIDFDSSGEIIYVVDRRSGLTVVKFGPYHSE